MSGPAIATMAIICGFIWGGFVVLLLRAIRRESGKTAGSGAEGSDFLSGERAI